MCVHVCMVRGVLTNPFSITLDSGLEEKSIHGIGFACYTDISER